MAAVAVAGEVPRSGPLADAQVLALPLRLMNCRMRVSIQIAPGLLRLEELAPHVKGKLY